MNVKQASRRHGRGKRGGSREDWQRDEARRTVCQGLEKVARQVGAKSIVAVAIAWSMQKAPNVFPTIEGRKTEDFAANVEALSITLQPDHIKYLEDIIRFDKGYPYTESTEGGSQPRSA